MLSCHRTERGLIRSRFLGDFQETAREDTSQFTVVPGILVDMTIKTSTCEYIGKCSEWRRKMDSVLLAKDSDT